MFIVYSYFVYLTISVTVTVWVARTLHRRGRVFLVDAFHGQEDMADSLTTCWWSDSIASMSVTLLSRYGVRIRPSICAKRSS